MRHATHSYCLQSSCLVDGDVMRPRDSLLSSGADDLWSVASLDDVLNAVDDDDNLATTTTDDDLPPQPSATTTTTTTTTRKSVKTKPTRSVVRRNERERNRVKLVNQGFDRLRQYVRLPGLSKKKLSKVDTLRAAVVYIKQLQSLLAATDAAAASAAPHHVTEQLLPSQHQSQHHLHHHQQQQPYVVADNVTSPTSGFLCLSLTGINSPVESSYDAAATTFGLLATPSTPLELALGAAYSTDGACLPLVDVNDNNCVVTEPCPPLSHEADLINMADAIEQQRRLSELTAWLLE